MISGLEMYTDSYTATGGEYAVEFDIEQYNPGTDFMCVFIDNEYVAESEYTLNASEDKVVFTEALTAGQVVDFLVFLVNGVDINTYEFGTPESRNEAILQNIIGGTNLLLEPESRIEVLLFALMKHMNIDASDNANVQACLTNVKTNWSNYSTGISFQAPVAAGGPVAGVIVYKYTDDYGAVLILSYHPMFPHPAYCRLFAGEWTTPYWI